MNKTLNELRDEALQNATEKGFTQSSPAEMIALIHSELSEALECLREGTPPSKMQYSYAFGVSPCAQPTKAFASYSSPTGENIVRGKPEGVPAEMADVIIRVLHFCGALGIDIDKAVKEKMAYNETRPFRHGGKRF